MKAPSDISWRRVSVEVVVVVGSILLAFGIQASWESREQRDLRAATLEGLLVDFDGTSSYLAAIVDANQWRVESHQLLISALQDSPNQSPVLVADSILVAVLTYPTYNPPRVSVEMALASGHLTTMEDQPLRRLLAQWLRQLDDTAEDEIRAAELVENEIAPLLASTPGLGELFAALPNRSIALPDERRHLPVSPSDGVESATVPPTRRCSPTPRASAAARSLHPTPRSTPAACRSWPVARSSA